MDDGTDIRRFILIKAGTLVMYPAPASSGSSNVEYQRGFSYYAINCSNVIKEVFKSRANLFKGTTIAKVWIDASVNTDGTGKP